LSFLLFATGNVTPLFRFSPLSVLIHFTAISTCPCISIAFPVPPIGLFLDLKLRVLLLYVCRCPFGFPFLKFSGEFGPPTAFFLRSKGFFADYLFLWTSKSIRFFFSIHAWPPLVGLSLNARGLPLFGSLALALKFGLLLPPRWCRCQGFDFWRFSTIPLSRRACPILPPDFLSPFGLPSLSRLAYCFF